MRFDKVPSLYREQPNVVLDDDTYDVFISHASEDKEEFVRQFVNALTNKGLKVWYDEFTLKIGDSLRQKIDRGLAKSRVGLVILSPSFIAKGWTNYELDGMVTRNISGEQVLLPIWHKLTKQDVIDFSPSLADKVARSTATHTVEEIANEIADLINSYKLKE
nr:toll/interleukin-1 receptor domain-containing protein [Wohlfahrtiimonas chitiniclastica]